MDCSVCASWRCHEDCQSRCLYKLVTVPLKYRRANWGPQILNQGHIKLKKIISKSWTSTEAACLTNALITEPASTWLVRGGKPWELLALLHVYLYLKPGAGYQLCSWNAQLKAKWGEDWRETETVIGTYIIQYWKMTIRQNKIHQTFLVHPSHFSSKM